MAAFIMLVKGFFARIWATIFPKEKNMTPFFTPDQLREKLKDRNYQLALVDWVNNTLRPLEDNAEYLKLCQASGTPVTTETIKQILDHLYSYMRLGTPVHDLGHHVRDGLGGSAIIAKDLFIRSGFRNDIDAGFWAAMFHDGSTGVQHRYIDNEWELNHGELQAVIFYCLTVNLLSEPVRRLAAYAIAAHPHALKDIGTKNGAIRKPWNDELFYDHTDRPVRLAVWITRWTDRLENGGDPATHLPRHALATVDGAIVGGMDLHKVDWYSFADSLKFLFTPQAIVTAVPVSGKDDMKVPSMLQHLQGYRMSADTSKVSPYNQHDSLSPSMTWLMNWKVSRSIEFVDMVTNTTGAPDFEVFAKLLRMVSGSPINESSLKAIEMVRDLWNLNTPEDQAHWAAGFKFALRSYYEWLTLLTDEIAGATDPTIKTFVPLVSEMVAKVTRF